MVAVKLAERIAPQLKIVPLNGLCNLYVLYNTFGDDLGLLQSIHQFLMSDNFLISFAEDSNHFASILFSTSGNL